MISANIPKDNKIYLNKVIEEYLTLLRKEKYIMIKLNLKTIIILSGY